MRNLEFAMRLVSEGVNDMEDRGFKVMPATAREAVAYVFGATEAVGSPDKIINSSAKAKQITKRVEEILKKGRVKKNPVLPRKGESERKFVSRCMSEEKKSFPKQKQRIAVCLSKARKNPLLESGATISRNSGINRRAASMT
jgi:hypothetical protein